MTPYRHNWTLYYGSEPVITVTAMSDATETDVRNIAMQQFEKCPTVHLDRMRGDLPDTVRRRIIYADRVVPFPRERSPNQ